ncbi:MAG TPA: hypothetical protein DEP45_11490 [Armatimonadetes bacterium]|nr:hypothetical protein [Armatimonadota bacterium]
MLLRTINTLGLTNEQLGALLTANQALVARRAEVDALRETTWAASQADIEAVLNAWAAGEAPPSRAGTAADRAVNRVNSAEADFVAARTRAAETLYNQLSEEQRALVESAGIAEARAARLARMGGVESPGAYVLTQTDAIRDLMTDEFDMLAPAEARRIAEAIVGPDAANLPQMTEGVLGILHEVYGWTPDRYSEQRPTLAQQIEEQLGIEAPAAGPPIPWAELERLMASARTVAVVDLLAPDAGGEVE